MDLIAVDIGNSTVSLGLFVDDKLSETQQFDTDNLADLAGIFRAMRKTCGPQPLGAKTVPVVACSVNPEAQQIVEKALDASLDQRLLLLGSDVSLDVKTAVEDPDAVGNDRLITAWAAYEVVGGAVVVADFGSATTIDCVNDNGIFLGGAIMPGLHLAAKSLKQNTAALPEITPELPEGDYGTNTTKAIQHGIYYGTIGALRELVERYATSLGHWPQVVATGGYAELIAKKCDFLDSLVPELCLNGLFLAYKAYRQNVDIGDRL